MIGKKSQVIVGSYRDQSGRAATLRWLRARAPVNERNKKGRREIYAALYIRGPVLQLEIDLGLVRAPFGTRVELPAS